MKETFSESVADSRLRHALWPRTQAAFETGISIQPLAGFEAARWAHVPRAVMIEMSTAKFRGSLGQAGAAKSAWIFLYGRVSGKFARIRAALRGHCDVGHHGIGASC